MKNLLIISPSLKLGGVERALTVLANHFASQGLSVTIINCLASTIFYEINPRVVIISPSFKRGKSAWNKVLFYVRLVFFLRSMFFKIDPFSILVYGDWFNPLALLASVNSKYKVYISDRTSPDYKFSFPIPLLKKMLYPFAAGFIAQTDYAERVKTRQFRGRLRIKTIPNAIRDVRLYPEIQRENVILYAGRFAWEKNPEMLIRAFYKTHHLHNWSLIMAGEGPLLSRSKQLVSDYHLEHRILFPGTVKDIDALFAKSSIFVLPSVIEGFPNILCEAMIAGLACICLDKINFGGIILPNQNGLVAKGEDIDDLSEKMMLLINDLAERNRLSKNAVAIRERLSVDVVGNEILSFISSHAK